MSNLEIWNQFCKPPATALREIEAGRLKGKSDINPQWRIKAMTEVFGVCGVGWKYKIVRLWKETGAHDEVMAFAEIKLYTKLYTKVDKFAGIEHKIPVWSEPIPGVGGHFFTVKEKGGMHNNDECWKMAITDALSVAMKQLGVASSVYEGMWDGSKYKDEPVSVKPADPALVKAAENAAANGTLAFREFYKNITKEQRLALQPKINELKQKCDEVDAIIDTAEVHNA